ncbi:unnamed protein product, partial [Prorocentrum cordatum]
VSDKQAANEVHSGHDNGMVLRRRAASTLNAAVVDPDTFDVADPNSAGHPATNADEIDRNTGQVFQRTRCVRVAQLLDRTATARGLNELSRQVLHTSTAHHFTLVHGPPGSGKTTAIVALVSAWPPTLNSGLAVGVFTGSNTAADQPLKSFSAAKRNTQLEDSIGFPRAFVRLARRERVDRK